MIEDFNATSLLIWPLAKKICQNVLSCTVTLGAQTRGKGKDILGMFWAFVAKWMQYEGIISRVPIYVIGQQYRCFGVEIYCLWEKKIP